MNGRLWASIALCIGFLAPFAAGHAGEAPTKDEVVAQVKKAVEFYKGAGREKALAEFNNKEGQFAKGEDYVDVHDTNGTCVAHPITPGIVGLNRMDQADPTASSSSRKSSRRRRPSRTAGSPTCARTRSAARSRRSSPTGSCMTA